jgi:hypothetical protein
MCLSRVGLGPLLLCAGLLALHATAASAGVEVGVAHVDEIEGESTHALSLSYLTRGTHPWEFMAGHIQSRSRFSPVHSPNVAFAALSKRLSWRGWFVQGGIAVTDSDTEALSHHWQFMTGGGYRFNRHWTLSLRHLSNANTGGHNRGENLLMLQYGF